MSFDFGNNLNWDLLTRSSYGDITTPYVDFQPIPPFSLVANKRILAVGTQSAAAQSHWYIGCWLSMRLFASPSSTSIFPALMEGGRYTAVLNQLTIIQFPELNLYPYLLVVRVPRWLRQLDIEVWEYSGSDTDPVLDSLNRIESAVTGSIGSLGVSSTYLSLSNDTIETYTYPNSFRGESINWELIDAATGQVINAGGDTVPAGGQTYYDAFDFQSDGAQTGQTYYYLETLVSTGQQVKTPNITLVA